MDLDAMDSHFQEIENVENVPVDRNVLHLLSKHGSFQAEELKLAYKKSSLYPQRLEWLNIAFRFFMAAGLLLFLSGIVFFFAYNWSSLHKFAKMGLVQSGIVAIALWLIVFKPSDFVQKLGLTAISVLVGVAFAVYGQIYQTGADAYDFFLGWTIFVTAWVAISSFPFLWLFYLILINTTLSLYLLQVQMSLETDTFLLLIAVLNSIALGIWEFVIKDNRKDWVQLFCVRLIGVAILTTLTASVIWAIFDYRTLSYGYVFILLYLGWMVTGGIYYSQKAKDIAFVAMFAISLLVIVNALFIRMVDGFDDFIGLFFILSFINIGATIGLVKMLIDLNKKWNLEKANSHGE